MGPGDLRGPLGEVMQEFIVALQKLIPKEMHILERRYQILRGIQLFAPIGRRGLSEKLSISEKIVRNEVEFLKGEAFISKSSVGVVLTDSGSKLIKELEPYMKQIEGLNTMEARIKEILDCPEVIIVSGDADHNEDTKAKIGKSAAEAMLKVIEPGSIIALTGGSTMYHMVNELKPSDMSQKNLMFVPARGSLRHKIIHQSNSLVARMGETLRAKYTLLNIPDNLSERALTSVMEEPEIKDAIQLLLDANILVFGIATSENMIQSRNLQADIRDMLNEKGAVAEALGNYFNLAGDIVYTTRSVGISIREMKNLRHPIAVAGGTSKGDAIFAVRKFLNKAVLVLDEGAAKQIMMRHNELGNIDKK